VVYVLVIEVNQASVSLVGVISSVINSDLIPLSVILFGSGFPFIASMPSFDMSAFILKFNKMFHIHLIYFRAECVLLCIELSLLVWMVYYLQTSAESQSPELSLYNN